MTAFGGPARYRLNLRADLMALGPGDSWTGQQVSMQLADPVLTLHDWSDVTHVLEAFAETAAALAAVHVPPEPAHVSLFCRLDRCHETGHPCAGTCDCGAIPLHLCEHDCHESAGPATGLVPLTPGAAGENLGPEPPRDAAPRTPMAGTSPEQQTATAGH